MHRIVAILTMIASIMVIALTSCSSHPVSSTVTTRSSSPQEVLPDPAVILKQASTTTRKLTSAHISLQVIGKLGDIPVKDLDADVSNDPGPAAQGNATITIMGSDVQISFVVIGGHLYALLPGSSWNDYGLESSGADITTILNPSRGLANVLTCFVDPLVQGKEILNGQPTIRIQGKVAKDALTQMLPSLQSDKRITTTVWIHDNPDHQVMQLYLEQENDNAIHMQLANWNGPITIHQPDLDSPHGLSPHHSPHHAHG